MNLRTLRCASITSELEPAKVNTRNVPGGQVWSSSKDDIYIDLFTTCQHLDRKSMQNKIWGNPSAEMIFLGITVCYERC
jgi:hypothetical protein